MHTQRHLYMHSHPCKHAYVHRNKLHTTHIKKKKKKNCKRPEKPCNHPSNSLKLKRNRNQKQKQKKKKTEHFFSPMPWVVPACHQKNEWRTNIDSPKSIDTYFFHNNPHSARSSQLVFNSFHIIGKKQRLVLWLKDSALKETLPTAWLTALTISVMQHMNSRLLITLHNVEISGARKLMHRYGLYSLCYDRDKSHHIGL